MSARSSDTQKLVLGALALWGLVRLLEGAGDGGSALAQSSGAKGKSSDTRDELAALPDELDVERLKKARAAKPDPDAAALRIKSTTKKGTPGVPIIDVYGPKVRKATPAELAAAKAKKTPKKPARPPGTVSASPELEPHHGPTLPAGYNPAKARARAPVIAAHLATKGPKAYSHTLLKEWQTLAAIRADGLYAGSTRGALVFYGVDDPPRPFGAPYATLPYHPPDMQP